jgi:hypothetical protein
MNSTTSLTSTPALPPGWAATALGTHLNPLLEELSEVLAA